MAKSKSKNTVKTKIEEDKVLLDNEESIAFDEGNSKLEELYSYECLLNISSVKYIDLIPGSTSMLVENLGVGDVYFGKLHIDYNKDTLMLTGGSKSFNEGVYLISASRPLVKITYYK